MLNTIWEEPLSFQGLSVQQKPAHWEDRCCRDQSHSTFDFKIMFFLIESSHNIFGVT